VAGLNFVDSCREAFVHLNIMTVVSLYLFETLTFVKRNLNKIENDSVTHSYDTRAKSNYIRPLKHKTKKFEKSVSFSGIALYNKLPPAIKELQMSQFKCKLHKFFINNAFYCINEFNVCNITLD
jgi:hypothetical protein